MLAAINTPSLCEMWQKPRQGDVGRIVGLGYLFLGPSCDGSLGRSMACENNGIFRAGPGEM